jgi:hypothetical protein
VGAEHPDFNNQYIVLSAMLAAIGIGFLTCIKRLERRGARLRALGYVYLFGGIFRLLFSLQIEHPALYLSLAVETLGIGALLYWHRRLERLYGFRK